MAEYYAQHEWGPWHIEAYRRMAAGLDPSTGTPAYDAYNNQPVYTDAQKQKAQELVNAMEKSGVEYSFQLLNQPGPTKEGLSFGEQFVDFITSPPVLIAAGAIGGMAAGVGSAAGGGGAAAGGVTGAAGELGAGGALGGSGAAGAAGAGSTAAYGNATYGAGGEFGSGATAYSGSSSAGAATTFDELVAGGSETSMPPAQAPSSAGYSSAPFDSASGASATEYTVSNPALAGATFGEAAPGGWLSNLQKAYQTYQLMNGGGSGGGGGFGDTLFNSAPALFAAALANDQRKDIDPYLDQLSALSAQYQGNQPAYLKSLTDPYDMAAGQRRSDLLQDQGLRGIRGSSFGNQSINNMDYITGVGRGNLLAQGINQGTTTQAGLIDQQMRGVNNRNVASNALIGSGLGASARLFGTSNQNPFSDLFGLSNLWQG